MTYLSHDILCPIRLELGEREREVNDLEFKLEKVSALPTVIMVVCVWWIFFGLVPWTSRHWFVTCSTNAGKA